MKARSKKHCLLFIQAEDFLESENDAEIYTGRLAVFEKAIQPSTRDLETFIRT